MEQPELGRKVAEIRNAIGMTQDELSQKCNLSLRTIQRIESGLVNPRSYSLKLIGEKLGYNFYYSEKKSKKMSSLSTGINNLILQIIQLFNLKTNTMKKLSILSATFILTSLGIFMLCTDSNAQKTESKFTSSNGRGIIYLFPKGVKLQISNTKDTANYQIGEFLVQEYGRNLFLNKKYVGQANIGDTIILDNGKLILEKPFGTVTSTNGNDIIYQFPKNLKVKNLSIQDGAENFNIGNYHVRELDRKIFLNGVYKGLANSNDTVVIKNGNIMIKTFK
ncbi:MAG: helix-turn-helix transcriptional regulator [Bacteroidales bacterium]|nr:helix-turn-helix transcriptional regulator [Bacteroidales bacterium]